jgi:predicted lysophospholipase L1 biosynthesis ABC-type transport system permease subunit
MASEDVTQPSYHESPSSNGDWPAQAADVVERAVGAVRDKTTGPVLLMARAAVYGLFAIVVGLVLAALFGIAIVRLVNNYLPESVFGTERVWAAHLIVGLVFVAAGAVLWARRRD